MEVTVEGETLSPEDFSIEAGWFTIDKSKRSARKSDSHEAGGRQDGVPNEGRRQDGQRGAANSAKTEGRKMAMRSVETQHVRLPPGLHKVVIRPQGGLRTLSACKTETVSDIVKAAAGIAAADARDDIVLLNQKQNTILVGTDSSERVRKYMNIGHLTLGTEKLETFAYLVTPDGHGKGVIQGVPLTHTIERVRENLTSKYNPEIVGVRRLGKDSTSILLLFADEKVPYWIYYASTPFRCLLYKKKYEVCFKCGQLGHRADVCPNAGVVKCRGCGMDNPTPDHSCELKCALCGKGHELGHKKCREMYRIPYILKKRQWEKQTQDKTANSSENTSNRRSRPRTKEDEGYRGRSVSFPRLGSRGHSSSRDRSGSRGRSGSKTHSGSRTGSQSRGRLSSRGRSPSVSSAKNKTAADHKEVSWVGRSSQNNSDRGADELLQLRKMVETLTDTVRKLTKKTEQLEKENSELRKMGQSRLTQQPKITHALVEAAAGVSDASVASPSLPPPTKKRTCDNTQPELTLAEVCRRLEDKIDAQVQATDNKIQAQIQSIFNVVQEITTETKRLGNELLAMNAWRQAVENKTDAITITLQQLQNGQAT